MENKIKSVTVKKTIALLGTYRTMFYLKYEKRLKEHAFKNPSDKRQTLYPLEKVMELRAELDAEKARIEILG